MTYGTISYGDFEEAFRQAGRLDSYGNNARKVLLDRLEEIDPDGEVDVVALCGEYDETSSEELAEKFGYDSEEEYETEEQYVTNKLLEKGIWGKYVSGSDTFIHEYIDR